MTSIKTSATSPLCIAEVVPDRFSGQIGITLRPGKEDPHGMTRASDRDLDIDLDVVERWGATVVVTLITDSEMDLCLGCWGLRDAVEARHAEWWHLPIRDGDVPGPDFERRWAGGTGEAIRDRPCLGFDVLIHCEGGLGRAGVLGTRLLVELGEDSENAIEPLAQEHHFRSAKPVPPTNSPKTK